MNRDNLLFAIIGILLGFIVGFIFASNILQREAIVAPAGARTQGLPADHPVVGADPAAPNGGGMQAEVQKALTKARNEPANFDAQFEAASLYFQIFRYDESIGYLLKANQINPDDFETVAGLAVANMEAGHFEVAIP